MILLLDNYDSFVYNLDRYLQRLGQRTFVVRSDAVNVDAIQRLNVSAIVISPGPKTPDEAGCSLEVVRRLGHRVPILGVCLGHQVIAQSYGAKIIRAKRPVHGRAYPIVHTSASKLFAQLPNTFPAARYHSLLVDPTSVPDCLQVIASTPDGLIMAIEHREWPVLGVQFHPESILTYHGYQILRNFLEIAKLSVPNQLPENDCVHHAHDT